MWNAPTKEQLSNIPKLYETEGINVEDKIIHYHFFMGLADFYICEYDGADTFFGYSDLGNGFPEWGYISFAELKDLKLSGWVEVDCDLHWKKRPAKEVDKICRGMGWPMPAKVA